MRQIPHCLLQAGCLNELFLEALAQEAQPALLVRATPERKLEAPEEGVLRMLATALGGFLGRKSDGEPGAKVLLDQGNDLTHGHKPGIGDVINAKWRTRLPQIEAGRGEIASV